jgi:hypothetical protein
MAASQSYQLALSMYAAATIKRFFGPTFIVVIVLAHWKRAAL